MVYLALFSFLIVSCVTAVFSISLCQSTFRVINQYIIVVSTFVGVVCLTYIYMLEFVLDDGTGWLSAGLWKEEAVREYSIV